MINSQTSTSTTITADTVHHATGVEEIKLESIPPELRPFSKFDGVMAKHPAGTVAHEYTGAIAEPARFKSEGGQSMPRANKNASDTVVQVRKPSSHSDHCSLPDPQIRLDDRCF